MNAKFAVGQPVVIMVLKCAVSEVLHTRSVGITYRVYRPMHRFYNAIEWRESMLQSVEDWQAEKQAERERLQASIRRKLAGRHDARN